HLLMVALHGWTNFVAMVVGWKRDPEYAATDEPRVGSPVRPEAKPGKEADVEVFRRGDDRSTEAGSAAQVRALARSGSLTGPTCGLAPGHLQANLVVLPESLASDFLRFCRRNPKPCPILAVTGPGATDPGALAPGADLRTDLPRYRVYRHGVLVDEPLDIQSYWRADLVAFLLGCSFSFDASM